MVGDAAARLQVESEYLRLVAELLSAAQGEGLRLGRALADDVRIIRAIDFAEAHLGEDLSVAGLASIACLSPAQFARVFRATTGEAVWSYVQRRRAEQARVLLLTTALPIAEIAYRCGYASQAHLTRCFKAAFGTTPGAARGT